MARADKQRPIIIRCSGCDATFPGLMRFDGHIKPNRNAKPTEHDPVRRGWCKSCKEAMWSNPSSTTI